MIWHQGTVPLFGLRQIQSKWYDTKLLFIWNSYMIQVHNMGDRNPKSRVYTDGFPRRSGSLLLYNGATQWPMEADGDGNGQQYSTAPIWKCRAGIGDHRITFPIDLLPNYTFFTNLTIFSIGWLLMEDVTSLLTLWKVCSIVWCRFNRIARSRPNEEMRLNSKSNSNLANEMHLVSKLNPNFAKSRLPTISIFVGESFNIFCSAHNNDKYELQSQGEIWFNVICVHKVYLRNFPCLMTSDHFNSD